MGFGLKETISVMKTVNTEAAKVATKQEIGGMLNDRLTKIVTPRLPMIIRGYADTEVGRLALANVFAAAIINYGYKNDKLICASEAMTYAAMKDFVESFNFREMVDEFLDGIDLDVLKSESQNKGE